LAGRRGDRPEAVPAPKTRQALPRRDKQVVGGDEATKENAERGTRNAERKETHS
jgi:hypothetical protein